MVGIKIRLSKESNWLKDSGHTYEEEKDMYNMLIEDILKNTRWYLDNLDYLPEFRVSFENYKKPKNKYKICIKNKNIYK